MNKVCPVIIYYSPLNTPLRRANHIPMSDGRLGSPVQPSRRGFIYGGIL